MREHTGRDIFAVAKQADGLSDNRGAHHAIGAIVFNAPFCLLKGNRDLGNFL
jgi:hypothetical protein